MTIDDKEKSLSSGEDRSEISLQALGSPTRYRMDYAPDVLETFLNKHPDNDYWVQFNCPEFTSLILQKSESPIYLPSGWWKAKV